MRAALAALAVMLPLAASAQEFVGAESCKACHPEAYDAWKVSKHARAMESLTPQAQKDARCVTCHAPDLRGREVAAVTCETCHGAGQHYSPEYVMKDPELSRLVGLQDPSERMCRACHDASSPSLQPFDFAEKLRVIDHWSEERARRGKAPAPAPRPKAKPQQKKQGHLLPESNDAGGVKAALAQAAAGRVPDVRP